MPSLIISILTEFDIYQNSVSLNSPTSFDVPESLHTFRLTLHRLGMRPHSFSVSVQSSQSKTYRLIARDRGAIATSSPISIMRARHAISAAFILSYALWFQYKPCYNGRALRENPTVSGPIGCDWQALSRPPCSPHWRPVPLFPLGSTPLLRST